MKKSLSFFIILSLFNYSLMISTFAESQFAKNDDYGRYIVGVSSVSDELKVKKDLEKLGVVLHKKLISSNSYVVSGKASDLKKIQDIGFIEEDFVCNITGKDSKIVQPNQEIPWGISKIRSLEASPVSSKRIKVGVIDTGIELTHPDLSIIIKPGINTINSRISTNDDNGHGTHVAGTIAALNNSIGVVGVSNKVDLYPIKALDRYGSGNYSDIIEGIDWCANNGIQVINMSLGGSNGSIALYQSIKNTYSKGVVLIASAGNNNGSYSSYPASYNEVISVSAVDSQDVIADFSAVGKVDVCAPGVSINSTYIGSTYKILSGTSMAAPHISGVAALILLQPSKYDINLDGILSPLEVLTRIKGTAVDLGEVGEDPFYGAGRVDAYRAVMD